MSFPRFFLFAAAVLITSLFAVGAPVVQTLSPSAGSTISSLTSIAVTFNEVVTGVDANDLLINNEAALAVTGSGAGPYTFTFTQPPPGNLNVSWDFDHGVAGVGTGAFVQNTWSYTLADALAPTIAKVRTSVVGQEQDAITPRPGSTVNQITQVEVNFSEIVTGVNASDLLVNNVPTTSVSGTDAGPYRFTFTQPAAGTVTFQWAASHAIVDSAAAPNNFAGGTWTVTRSATPLGALVINEFLAANAIGLNDENGNGEDWIEIHNPSTTTSVNLTGWALTNDLDQPGMWTFPSRTLGPNAYLVIFASGKDRKPASGNLHTNFKINETGGYLALASPEVPNIVMSAFTDYPSQRFDYSYGSVSGASRFLAPPTPGAANTSSTAYTSVTPKPNTSVARGFFKEQFQLVLSCTDASATIRYTLDGSVPTATSSVYAAPLTIGTTTVLRAVAFGSSAVPSTAVTHSYIFLDQVLNQPSPPYDNPANSGDNTNPQPPSVGGVPLPVAWGTSGGGFPGLMTNLSTNQVPADYGMDPEIFNDPAKYEDTGAVNAAGKLNLDRVKQGLRDLPIMSIVMKTDDMFGAGGLYPNSTVKGTTYEKACSVEMILPDGSTAFATTCGIRIHGNASRNAQNTPKHGFKLNFKGDFGASNLEYRLFPESPVTKFEDLILRADYNSSWLHWDGAGTLGASGGQRARGTRIRDAWCKDTFRAMGRAAGHNRHVNLFINGVFWGTYDPAEQENNSFAAAYYGGDKDDFDVVEQGSLKSGTLTAYTAMTSIASPIDNPKYEQMKGYLDVPEFIDYMLLHFFTAHQDWGDDMNKNWYAVRPKNGTFKFIPWDQENLLWDHTIDRTGVGAPPGGLHPKLVTNAQYLLDFADRAHRHLLAPDGALLPAPNIARWNKWKAHLTNAIAGESARWGDYRRDVHQYSSGPYPLYTWNSTVVPGWIAENNRLTGIYFPNRITNSTNPAQGLLPQLRTRGLYPMQDAPEFRDHSTNSLTGSRRVASGFQLRLQMPVAQSRNTSSALTNNTGTIYFTTNGSDPRVYYTGAVAASAQVYSGPIAVDATTVVKARSLNGGTWSALNEVTLSVGFNASPVRITEILYNPTNGNGGTAAEFLELQNTGTHPVNLGGFYFEGIDFIFPNGFTLGGGDRMVLASNDAPTVFAAQHPAVVVSGWYGGALDNNGERIALIDPAGRTVVSVDYDDDSGWPTLPDTGANGNSYSLEITDVSGNPDDPANWKASSSIKGSPGQVNSASPTPTIEISEVLAENASIAIDGATSDFVELRNTTGAAISLAGWGLSNDGAPRKFTFPAGTSIAANGFLVVVCDTGTGALPRTGFALNGSAAGDKIQLYDASATPTRVDGVSWGNQAANFSIAKIAGSWQLATPTPMSANTAATPAPVSNLAINEWLANSNPGEPDWLELYNKHATQPVALRGLHLQTGSQLFQLSSLAFLAPQKWLQLFADEAPGENHVDFNLPAAGTTLSLLDAGGTTLDGVTFGAQAQGVSQGRNPDGSATIVTFARNSGGAANYVASGSGVVLSEVLVINATGATTPWGTRAGFVELQNTTASAVGLAGMRLGTTPVAADAWPFPSGSIPPNGFFSVWCDTSAHGQSGSGADLNSALSLGGNSGDLYLFNSAGQIVDSVAWGFQVADRPIGRSGTDWALLSSATRTAANSAAATLGSVSQLRINEWLALSPPVGMDWFELYNLDANPVRLTGLYLTDDPSELGRTKFQVGPLSFIAGNGWVKWEATDKQSLGRNHVNFSLDANGESLRISNNDAGLTVINVVTFGLQTANVTQGRIPDGDPAIQVGLTATPGAKNVLGPPPSIATHPASLVVNQGATVAFQVAANGAAPLTYQWRRNGVNIAGASSATLNLNAVTSGNDGEYIVIVTNTAGSAPSNPATLTVLQTYSQWATSKGIAGANPAADADTDGLRNIAEFFHNLNPNAPLTAADAAALPKVGVEPPTGTPQFITLTYRRNARAAVGMVEHQLSATLGAGTWSVRSPDETEMLAADPITGDPVVRVKFALQAGDLTKFIRLQLTE